MTVTIDGDNLDVPDTSVTNGDSPFTTSGEQYYAVDTSGGAVTFNLADADRDGAQIKRLIDVGGSIETNAVTISPEGGTPTVDGGSSVTWDQNNGSYVDIWSDGTDWFTSLQQAADSVGAGSAVIGSGDTIEQVEFGTVSVTGPGASSNDNISDRAVSSESVSFSSTFGSTPSVVGTVETTFTALFWDTVNVSTTGFDARLINYVASDRSGDSFDFHWVAFGP